MVIPRSSSSALIREFIDSWIISVCRYVERNASRARLVRRAEDWRWGSLWRWTHGDRASRAALSAWRLARPRNWRQRVNQPLTAAELKALRLSVHRGQPYGHDGWVQQMVRRFGLDSTLRPRGRPRKQKKGS